MRAAVAASVNDIVSGMADFLGDELIQSVDLPAGERKGVVDECATELGRNLERAVYVSGPDYRAQFSQFDKATHWWRWWAANSVEFPRLAARPSANVCFRRAVASSPSCAAA